MYLGTVLCHLKPSSSDAEGGGEVDCLSAPSPCVVPQPTSRIVFILLSLALTFFTLPFSDSLFHAGATGRPRLMMQVITYHPFPQTVKIASSS